MHKTLQVIELHPSFGAEVRGLDFSQDIPDAVFTEVLEVIAKVSQRIDLGGTDNASTNLNPCSTESFASLRPVSTMPGTLLSQGGSASWTT